MRFEVSTAVNVNIKISVAQWLSNCGARPPRGVQHTFLQKKIKTALNQLQKQQQIKIHIEKRLMSTV
jgi:hypothetical protein